MNANSLSYAIAALAFGSLGLWVARARRGEPVSRLLAVACLISALWALAYLLGTRHLPYGVLEVLRNAAWFAFLISLLGPLRPISSPRWLLAAYCGLALLLDGLLWLGVLPRSALWILFAGAPAALLQAVIGLVLLEQVYRNTIPDHRWGIKFVCLGLASIFGFDFYLFAQTVLFRAVDVSLLQARGLVNALAVPLILLSVLRNPGFALRFTVSRRALFHSASLLAAGIYLLLMAAAGYYIRYFGGDWGGVFQVTFLVGAVLVLLAAMFSGTLRAYVRVFLSKHFFAYRFDYREEWLRFTRSLSEGEPGLHLREHAVRAMAALIDSTGGALWMRGEEGGFRHVAHWNMRDATGDEPAGSAFCQFLERKQWVIDTDEFDRLPESYSGLSELPGWLTAMSAARYVVPLVLHDRLIGWIVLAPSRGNLQLNWEVSDLLKTAGRQAAGYLAQLEAAQSLLVSRQFESFNRMSAFVIHDLKNVVAQLSLLLANAARHKHNPAFQEDMLETIGHAIDKMNRLLMQLRKGAQPIDRPDRIDLAGLLNKVVMSRQLARPQPELLASGPGLLVHADADRLERVVGHLVQNAIDACQGRGQVTVSGIAESDRWLLLSVTDTGSGMSEQFIRERLFRPFESTKAMGMGIGTYESREYVRQLGGDILVESLEGQGTTFRVRLPLASAASGIVGQPTDPRGERCDAA